MKRIVVIALSVLLLLWASWASTGVIISRSPGVKSAQWAIDPGVVAYNAARMGLPMPRAVVPLWEGAGLQVVNPANNANNATAIGTTSQISWTNAPIGRCVDFVGDARAGFSLEQPIIKATSEPWSIVFAAQGDGDADEAILLGEYDSGNNFIWLQEGTAFTFRNATGTTMNFTSITSFTDWHQYTLTSNGAGDWASDLILYRDGIHVETDSGTSASFQLDCIGTAHTAASTAFDGRIGYIICFDHTLNAAQVATLNADPYGLVRQPFNIASVYVSGAPPAGVMAPYYYMNN